MEYQFYSTPLGLLQICADNRTIKSISFTDDSKEPLKLSSTHSTLLTECVNQLDEYFRGVRRLFDLPLEFSGTEFQKRVWCELSKIPFGEVRSYKQIASALGNPKSVRAVGAANHKNPLVIIVPCHRVIGSDGSLIGYGGGIWRKQWLLNHERNLFNR